MSEVARCLHSWRLKVPILEALASSSWSCASSAATRSASATAARDSSASRPSSRLRVSHTGWWMRDCTPKSWSILLSVSLTRFFKSLYPTTGSLTCSCCNPSGVILSISPREEAVTSRLWVTKGSTLSPSTSPGALMVHTCPPPRGCRTSSSPRTRQYTAPACWPAWKRGSPATNDTISAASSTAPICSGERSSKRAELESASWTLCGDVMGCPRRSNEGAPAGIIACAVAPMATRRRNLTAAPPGSMRHSASTASNGHTRRTLMVSVSRKVLLRLHGTLCLDCSHSSAPA
mmetsp:Transcript_43840/g.81966  ORF Transcript_43840/g.81966 Transcript_43840/m.81966 type:complete len:291 (-) Transcript_43840:578-1450(-)